MLGAAVAALAVDDHARGQHERAVEAARGERAQQLRRPEVVVGDVVGDVAEVDAEADHRRLVADRGDAFQRALEHVAVAHVALDELGALVEVVGPLAVRGLEQQVEDPHVVTLLEQGVDDVGADEAGAAGDEDHRRGRLASGPCPT